MRARGDLTRQVIAALVPGPRRVDEVAQALGIPYARAGAMLSYLCNCGRVARVERGLYGLPEPDAPGENYSPEQLPAASALDDSSITLLCQLPDTGLPQANPHLLQDALRALIRFSAAYTGPANGHTAVEVTLAAMHVQRALGLPDSDLLPRSRGFDDLLSTLGPD